MRSKLSLGILIVVLGAGLCWGAPPPTDTQTMETIQSKLDHAELDQHGSVQVAVAGGVATLTGTVDNLGSKLDAENAARKVRGVTQVIDNIQVNTTVSDAQVLEQARHEIVMYYGYTIFDNVELAAHNGTLRVAGQVTEPFKKNDIGKILERVNGVAVLDNNLDVLPLSDFDNRLRLQVARAIYGDPNFVNYANLARPPIHIIVNNGNVTLEGVVANSFDKTKANMDALHAGLSFSVVDHLQVENHVS